MISALLCGWLLGSDAPAETPFEKNDTLLFYGNAMVERLLEHGELEGYLQLANPEKNLRVRSLAWTGDEVGWRLRPEGYVEHLRTLLAKWPAQVVVLGYGMNESFAGAAGLADFRAQLEGCLREVERLHPNAKLVLLSPLAVEDNSPNEAAARNRDLADYAAALGEAARMHHAQFIDLFAASQAAYGAHSEPLTTLGMHLNATGCGAMAKIIAQALVGDQAVDRVDPARLAEVAKAAAQKSRSVADLVRPKNGVVYFGVRKRADENAAEIPRYHALIDQADATLQALVRDPRSHFADFPAPSLPPMPPGKSTPSSGSAGVIKEPAEQQREFTVADGYELNLFASEAEFPDLKNPVQMAFDARGRLWVATLPSFPHTPPGAQPADKILILEDTDRDGHADKCTTFAEGFDALDGIAFHERGLIVSAQPRLLLLTDSDGDDRADGQTELLRGVDVTDSHHGGMVDVDPLGQVIFSDGVFHRSQFETPFGVVRGIDSTTYRLDPATGWIEREWQTMTPNPWKVAFDRYGDIFQHYGGGHVLEGLPLSGTPFGVYHPYGHGMVLNYNKGCALEVISSLNFPAEFQQGLAQGTLLGSFFVSLSKLDAETGPLVTASRLDVISSPNAAFRPVDIGFGFDGAMYVADFCSSIIGHAQHPMRDPQWDHEHGRIWRVVRKDGPISRDWPKVEQASVDELLALLQHPQNLVRQHARLRLRGLGGDVVPAIDRFLAKLDRSQPGGEQAVIESLWVLQAKGQARPAALAELAKSGNPLIRAAAVQLVRFQFTQIPNAAELLTRMAADAHPRVRMAVLSVVARLREKQPQLESAVASMAHGPGVEPAIKTMLADLAGATKPVKSRSVPVLEVSPQSQIKEWLLVGETGMGDVNPFAKPSERAAAKGAPPKTRTYRTLLACEKPQTALLSVKYGYLDVAANGVQLLSVDSPYSSEQQVEVPLVRGLNLIEIALRRTTAMPQVNLSDPLGQPLAGVRFPAGQPELQARAADWAKAHAAEANALRVQAVANKMQFAPTTLRVQAGAPVRLIFENPDLMLHNFVLLAPGTAEEVGALADQMAAQPDALAKNYVPTSPKVLHFTPLLQPGKNAELNFTAPAQPGRYPFLCTFPGHWRVMRGELVVEGKSGR